MASLDYRQVIVRPLVTEKSSAAYQLHKAYTFQVHPEASKPQLRQALETLFDVTVTDVRTMQMRRHVIVRQRLGADARGHWFRRAMLVERLVVHAVGQALHHQRAIGHHRQDGQLRVTLAQRRRRRHQVFFRNINRHVARQRLVLVEQ